MKPVEAIAPRGWEAALQLGFERCGERSVLARRSSFGPLALQKALYPEGGLVCHAILLHPPGGIAGGDRLDIAVEVGCGAHALLTTPGATKWYRSAAGEAVQAVGVKIARNAVCEWMPQENIFFNATCARNILSVELQEESVFCGWDVMCLGRTASGERFQAGRIRQQVRVTRGGQPLLEEMGTLQGGGALLDSPIGLAGYPVCATFMLAGVPVERATLDICRAAAPAGDCRFGVTVMGDLLVARCLARTAEAARACFLKIWEHLRPQYATVPARAPRIWAT